MTPLEWCASDLNSTVILNLEMVASEGLDAKGGSLSAPIYTLVARPPARTLFSVASKHAVRGYSLETGFWWRYTFNERARFCGNSTMVTRKNDISINFAELLGMVMSAWMLLIVISWEMPC